MRSLLVGFVVAAGLVFGQARPIPSPFVTSGSTSGGTCGALAGDVTGTCAATVLASIPNGVQDAITRLGTIASGVWQGTLVGPTYGGTGVNNASKTITLGGNLVTSGAFNTTVTVTADSNSTLPAGTKTLVATDVATLSSLASVGTITTGVWQGTKVGLAYGGTNADLSATGGTSQVLKQSSTGAAVTVGTLASTNLSDTANILLTNTPSIVTQNGALNAPAFKLNGTIVAGGDATTTKPYFLLEVSGATSNAWGTSGTYLGINSDSGFTGNILDLQKNGLSLFRLTAAGAMVLTQSGGIFNVGGFSSGTLGTTANCSSAAAPAVCAAAASGSVVVAAAATTVVVNTTRVTANSQILLMFDSSLGTKLSVTCNATEPALYGVTARTAATSFTITSTAPVTNPACFSYTIIN